MTPGYRTAGVPPVVAGETPALRTARRRPRGFTLLEMMVMVFIIAILSVIMTGFLGSARIQARRVQCANNLRQIAKALYQYADEAANKGFLPTTSTTANPYAVSGSTLPSLNLCFKFAYARDSKVFSCPCSPLDPELLRKIRRPGKDMKLPDGGANMVSSYGYDPGHSARDSQAVLAADKKGARENSDNHSPSGGQNVLIGAGVVEFLDTPARTGKSSDEDIYSRNPTRPRKLDAWIRQ